MFSSSTFHKSHAVDSLFVWNQVFYVITIIGQIDQVSINEQTQAFSESKSLAHCSIHFQSNVTWLTCKSCTYSCLLVHSSLSYSIFSLFRTSQLLILVGCLCLAMQLHDQRQLDQFGYHGLQLRCHQHDMPVGASDQLPNIIRQLENNNSFENRQIKVL